MYSTIGFIGTGSMGSAIARGAVLGSPESTFYFANRTPSKAEALAASLGKGRVVTNMDIARTCSLIFLGVKPQMMKGMLHRIAPLLQVRSDRFVLVTMAAGISTAQLQEMAGLPGYPVIRIMPNTPAAVGAGVTQVCSDGATEAEIQDFLEVMRPTGLLDVVREDMLDAACALSGCGPAFVSLFIEALADGGVACGLPRDKAMAYAVQTVEGTAKLMMETGMHPGAMKDAVTSPGGTAIQGVRALEEHSFRAAAMDAVIAAYERTLRISGR